MRILVDGDPLVYRAAWAGQKTKYRINLDEEVAIDFDYKKEMMEWHAKEMGDREEVPPPEYQTFEVLEPIANVLATVKAMVRGIQEHFGQEELEIYLGGVDNFRNDVAVTRPYKGNRPPKPKHYQSVRDYLEKIGAIIVDGQEADDALSIAQYAEWMNDQPSCIVTIDKDLDMVPGRHYNFVKKLDYVVEECDAERFFFVQLLAGDSTDNIQGIPGIGMVKAERILAGLDHEEAWYTIKDMYKEAYPDNAVETLLEMGRLLWMRRNTDEMWEFPL